jgi:hypothetical protein
MNYSQPAPVASELRLEAVTVCVGFDDLLDVTLQTNHPHLRLLPSAITYHLCARKPQIGENWDGNRRQPRLDQP